MLARFSNRRGCRSRLSDARPRRRAWRDLPGEQRAGRGHRGGDGGIGHPSTLAAGAFPDAVVVVMQISREPVTESAKVRWHWPTGRTLADARVGVGRVGSRRFGGAPHRAGIARCSSASRDPRPVLHVVRRAHLRGHAGDALRRRRRVFREGERDGGSRRVPRPDPGKSSSRTCVEPDTETTALAVVRDTPLSPLMGRLRQKRREFAYPEIGLTLTLDQRWDTAGAETDRAAVWDSAELLARYMATSGAAHGVQSRRPERRRARGIELAFVDDDGCRRRGARSKTVGGSAPLETLGGGLGLASVGRGAHGRDGAVHGRRRPGGGHVRAERPSQRAAADDSTASCESRTAEVARISRRATVEAPSRRRRRGSRRGGVFEPGTEGRAKAYPDVVLLADVVYGERPDAWRGLTRTCAALVGPGTVVLLSHTRRGIRSQRKFFDWLRDAGFVVEAGGA